MCIILDTNSPKKAEHNIMNPTSAKNRSMKDFVVTSEELLRSQEEASRQKRYQDGVILEITNFYQVSKIIKTSEPK